MPISKNRKQQKPKKHVRSKERDTRDYDTTQLRPTQFEKGHHRDYSAHFFRWGFVRRFIDHKKTVLDVGCGVEFPLVKVLMGGSQQRVKHYTGVDLNSFKPESKNKKLSFYSKFNFVKSHEKLLTGDNSEGFDIVVHLEVLEHMHVDIGAKFLEACFKCVKPGGLMIMSTPCYDGVRHAANHIHEYTIPELHEKIIQTGFEILQRRGTFMDVKHIAKNGVLDDENLSDAIHKVYEPLATYYSNDTLSCIFAPLFPDHSRNNIWICKKQEK